LVIGALALPAVGATNEPPPSRQDELERAIGEAGVAEVAALRELTAAQDRRAAAEAELVALDGALAAAEVRVAEAERMADRAAARYFDLYYSVADRKSQVRGVRAHARSAAVDLYLAGARDPGWQTLTGYVDDDFSDAGARSVYLEEVAAVRRESLHAAESSLDGLEREAARAEDLRAAADDAVAAAEVEREHRAAIREEQADRRADLALAERDEQRALERIRAEKAGYEDELARLVAESSSIAQMLAARQASQPRSALVVTRPVPGPIVSEFGPRMHPILGYVRLHQGVDIDAAMGDRIVSAADGVVVWADARGGYGNCVIIDHGNQFATLYAHQSQVAVQIGDTVTAGQTIGFIGSTGLSTGPHLHFEVRDLGIPTDPAPYL
jgi:murein DD-endopeptidase MepM/ murein hydrolase activator NlpD